MKESVKDLLELVGGGVQTHGPVTAAAPMRSGETRKAASVPKRAASVHQNGHAHAEPVVAEATRGRNEIPMEGDFKNF